MILIQEPLYFHFPFADTMCFIPVHFGFTDIAALQPHLRQSFKLSPAAATELFLKPHNITNPAPTGNCCNFLDFSNYLKMHLKFHL
jgi:hypothetical protein